MLSHAITEHKTEGVVSKRHTHFRSSGVHPAARCNSSARHRVSGYPQGGVYTQWNILSLIREGHSDISHNTDEPEDTVRSEQPITNRQVLYDYTDIALSCPTDRVRKSNVVTRAGGGEMRVSSLNGDRVSIWEG